MTSLGPTVPPSVAQREAESCVRSSRRGFLLFSALPLTLTLTAGCLSVRVTRRCSGRALTVPQGAWGGVGGRGEHGLWGPTGVLVRPALSFPTCEILSSLEILSVTQRGRKKYMCIMKYRDGLVTQLCPTLCDFMDWSLPGSSARGLFQARILEQVAIPFSRGSSQPREQTQVSCIAGGFFTD